MLDLTALVPPTSNFKRVKEPDFPTVSIQASAPVEPCHGW